MAFAINKSDWKKGLFSSLSSCHFGSGSLSWLARVDISLFLEIARYRFLCGGEMFGVINTDVVSQEERRGDKTRHPIVDHEEKEGYI